MTGVLKKEIGADTHRRMPREDRHREPCGGRGKQLGPQGATDGQLPPAAYRFQKMSRAELTLISGL